MEFDIGSSMNEVSLQVHLKEADSFYQQLHTITLAPGFSLRLENLGSENGHGKVVEHEQLAKGHGNF